MSQKISQVKTSSVKSKEISKLDQTWNGINQELINYRTKTLGKLLTIIDAIIVDEKQNKSVKNLITNTIWENDYTETNMAKWLIWLDNTTNISEEADNDESVPMRYTGIPSGSLDGYRPR